MSCVIKLLMLLTFVGKSLTLDNLLPLPVPNSDCPLVDDVNHAVMLSYAQNCNKYYSCLKGMAYLQQCPNNLHWSPLTYRCDYPEKAKCEKTPSDSLISLNPTNQAISNIMPASITSEVLYQLHPSECSKYYKCQALACPTNYYWNSRTQKCDFPHNANCPFLKETNVLTNPMSVLNLSENSLSIHPNQGEVFALHYPNDCGKFYQCQTMLCPINYHWNPHLQKCDLPQMAQCYQQPQMTLIPETSTAVIPTAFTAPTTTAVTTPTNTNGSVVCLDCIQRCEGYFHQYLPHPYDCHKFIQCNGWSFIQTCPDNLFWNAKLNTCDRICVTI